MKPMHNETTLASETIFTGRIIRVTKDTVQLENGSTSTREVVHHNGGACVAALTETGEVYLVRQFRYPYGKELTELPAGKLEPGEDPRVAALRELEEEVGVQADEMISLGEFYPSCGYCNEIIYLYAAKGLHQTRQHLDEDEFVTVQTAPLQSVVQQALSGELQDGKTIAAVLRLNALRSAGKF
jgi:ADP-ribose pyrophosphatase